MFEVPEGTECRCIKEGAEWYPQNFREHTTKKRNLFDKHEVVIDPVGKLGTHAGHSSTIGGYYAKTGWYGFRSDGWILLIPGSKVKYLD